MKFHITSPDAFARVDGTVQRTLLEHLPNHVGLHDTDVVVIPISFYQDFQFRRDLPAIIGSKRWILVDYLELGLDWEPNGVIDSHVLGRNSANFSRVSGPEWMRLDSFVRDHPPLVYFKRELLAREHSDWLQPLEFPGYLPIPTIQTKEEFHSRPVEAFLFWGLSHPSRPRLHGDIFRNAYSSGYEVISQFSHWNGYFADLRDKTWASIHAPHFDRKPISEILHFNHRSKISVSLPGAGFKCFRDTEAPNGAIPAFLESPIGHAFPWVHGENCIRLKECDEWQSLFDATLRDDLYDIYIQAQENIARYGSERYIYEYIIPSIQAKI